MSCIVVNFNGSAVIAPCLDSLLSQVHPPDEILVVDNGSQDGSLEFIQERYADSVQLIPLPENLGFGGACNRGFEQARGELIAVLNNDLVLHPRWLSSLLASNHPEWAFWASKIILSETGPIDSAGDEMAVIGVAYKIGHGDPVQEFDTPREVFGPCGAAALYRRELLTATGGFDSDFFLIHEDSDISLRARLLGYRCLYVPDAVVHHRPNTSIGRLSEIYVFFGHRNSEWVFWKNFPLALLLLYLPERLLFDVLCFFYFLWQGKAITYLRAKMAFLRSLPQVLGKRRKIQNQRRLTSRQLNALLDRNWLRYRWKSRAVNGERHD